jgi:Zn-dependent protease
MGQAFGSHGHIVLYGGGGLAIGSNDLRSRGQRMAVSFAGPLAGFLLLGVLFAFLALVDRDRFRDFLAVGAANLGLRLPFDVAGVIDFPLRLTDFALIELIFVNLIWGLLNLVPVWPLDGGQISREFCGLVFPGRGLRVSLALSFGVAAVLAVHSILRANGKPHIPFLPFGSMFTAILFGLLAIDSFQQLQRLQRDRDYWDQGWERDPNIWGR